MELTQTQHDALIELLNIGFGRAAASLSELTGHRVLLEVPTVSVHPIAELNRALRPLLADQVFANFAGAIEERNRNKQRHETTLVGILSADIVGAALKGDEAQVTVKFVSQQINVTKDQEGRIIDGDPSEVANITDVWTFARSVKSRDPNWALTATESPQ